MDPSIETAFRATPEKVHESSGHVDLIDLVRAELALRWPEKAQSLNALVRYSVLPGGKLLRPLLVLDSALAVGGNTRQVLPAALGMEYVHAGSLVHDDLIDGDDTRRDQASAHQRFGREHAVLTGNALFFHWFDAVGECLSLGVPADRVMRAVAEQAAVGIEVCHGAHSELAMAGSLDCGIAEYRQMIRRKTALLLAACCRVGAILAGAGDSQVDQVGQFGEHLGIAFQIRDDLIPYGARVTESGKPADSDLRNRRPTLPIILAWQSADAADREILHNAFHHPLSDFRQVHEVVHRSGAYDAAHAMALEESAKAHDALADLPDSPGKRRLTHLADVAAREARLAIATP